MQEKRVTAKATTHHEEILYAGAQQGVVLKETGYERAQWWRMEQNRSHVGLCNENHENEDETVWVWDPSANSAV